MTDHDRGCEGRQYTCTCGHDAKRDELIARLTKALEPFSKAAGELYARNWNASQVVMSFSAEEGIVKLTAGDFFAARSALSSSSTSREGER